MHSQLYVYNEMLIKQGDINYPGESICIVKTVCSVENAVQRVLSTSSVQQKSK